MRNLPSRAAMAAIAAGIALAGCGGDGSDATNVADANITDANLMLQEPGNDASAMDSAVNAGEPAPVDMGNQGSDSTDVLGNTSGGDTGGNTVDGNAAGL